MKKKKKKTSALLFAMRLVHVWGSLPFLSCTSPSAAAAAARAAYREGKDGRVILTGGYVPYGTNSSCCELSMMASGVVVVVATTRRKEN